MLGKIEASFSPKRNQIFPLYSSFQGNVDSLSALYWGRGRPGQARAGPDRCSRGSAGNSFTNKREEASPGCPTRAGPAHGLPMAQQTVPNRGLSNYDLPFDVASGIGGGPRAGRGGEAAAGRGSAAAAANDTLGRPLKIPDKNLRGNQVEEKKKNHRKIGEKTHQQTIDMPRGWG